MQHRDSELLKSFHSNIQDGGPLEILQWFHSDIKDGHHGSLLGHFENLQITSASVTVSLIELKLDGRYWVVIEIQNC